MDNFCVWLGALLILSSNEILAWIFFRLLRGGVRYSPKKCTLRGDILNGRHQTASPKPQKAPLYGAPALWKRALTTNTARAIIAGGGAGGRDRTVSGFLMSNVSKVSLKCRESPTGGRVCPPLQNVSASERKPPMRADEPRRVHFFGECQKSTLFDLHFSPSLIFFDLLFLFLLYFPPLRKNPPASGPD